MSEWISVKDRLPEPDKDVLLCSGLGNFRMAVGGKYELDGGIAHREKRREKLNMKNKNLRRLRCLVKAQTLWHLERLAYLDGCGDVGRMVDKLTRDKVLALRQSVVGPELRGWIDGKAAQDHHGGAPGGRWVLHHPNTPQHRAGKKSTA